jgi:hypothetical protein
MSMRHRRFWVTEDSLNASLRIDISPTTHRGIWSSGRKAKLSRSMIYFRWSLVGNLIRPDVSRGTASLWQ